MVLICVVHDFWIMLHSLIVMNNVVLCDIFFLRLCQLLWNVLSSRCYFARLWFLSPYFSTVNCVLTSCPPTRLAPLLAQDGAMDQVLTEVAAEFTFEDFSHLMWKLFEQVSLDLPKFHPCMEKKYMDIDISINFRTKDEFHHCIRGISFTSDEIIRAGALRSFLLAPLYVWLFACSARVLCV